MSLWLRLEGPRPRARVGTVLATGLVALASPVYVSWGPIVALDLDVIPRIVFVGIGLTYVVVGSLGLLALRSGTTSFQRSLDRSLWTILVVAAWALAVGDPPDPLGALVVGLLFYPISLGLPLGMAPSSEDHVPAIVVLAGVCSVAVGGGAYAALGHLQNANPSFLIVFATLYLLFVVVAAAPPFAIGTGIRATFSASPGDE